MATACFVRLPTAPIGEHCSSNETLLNYSEKIGKINGAIDKLTTTIASAEVDIDVNSMAFQGFKIEWEV